MALKSMQKYWSWLWVYAGFGESMQFLVEELKWVHVALTLSHQKENWFQLPQLCCVWSVAVKHRKLGIVLGPVLQQGVESGSKRGTLGLTPD